MLRAELSEPSRRRAFKFRDLFLLVVRHCASSSVSTFLKIAFRLSRRERFYSIPLVERRAKSKARKKKKKKKKKRKKRKKSEKSRRRAPKEREKREKRKKSRLPTLRDKASNAFERRPKKRRANRNPLDVSSCSNDANRLTAKFTPLRF
jgi:hypothetical protein